MKTLSLKLDDRIFEETEEMSGKLHLARNRYINEAVNVYNLVQKRRLLKKALANESTLAAAESLDILREFDMLIDGN